MWKKIEFVGDDHPHRLDASDVCIYARDYTSRKGFGHSETNNLIKNLKIKVHHRGSNRWHFKEKAIKQFAKESVTALLSRSENFVLAPIPSSKCRDHAEFDDRLEQVVKIICRECPRAVPVQPVVRTTTLRAAHESGEDRPSPSEVRASLGWGGLPEGTKLVVFLDDVITSGTTFKECKRLVQQRAPGVKVYGMFWARTVWE